MTLAELIRVCDDAQLLHGSGDIEIRAISDDSRTVTPGCAFIARCGSERDGRAYISEAISRGAVAIMVDTDRSQQPPADDPNFPIPPLERTPLDRKIVWVRFDHLDHHRTGMLAEHFYGYPSKKLKLIGITGTNGKTTTAYLIRHLLDDLGVRCGLISTVATDDGACRSPAKLTTPGAVEFSRLLAAMVENGCHAAVAEVSSHALAQGRTAALAFDIAVFTNLTGDHLNYHGTMDEYAAAKALLFEHLSATADAWAVVNADDPYARRITRDCLANIIWTQVEQYKELLGVQAEGVGSAEARPTMQCTADSIEFGRDATQARFNGPWGTMDVNLPLVGRHNISNALQAAAVVHILKPHSRDQLICALERCPCVPGRLEPVDMDSSAEAAEHPTVIVDYAHTHDALENVLRALNHLPRKAPRNVRGVNNSGNRHDSVVDLNGRQGKLIAVFGAGGDRDRSKRPKMASVAIRLADQIVITSDNPRTEDPRAIIADVLSGVPDEARGRVSVEPDRAAAIATTILQAQPEDVVLIAGKGHEDYQIIGTKKYTFDDRVEAAAALRRRVESA